MTPSPSQHDIPARTQIVLALAATLILALSMLAGCASTSAAKPAESPKYYAFWPPAPAEPRIQFLRSFSMSSDIDPREQSSLDKAIFGDEAQRAVDIKKPYGLAMRDGKIYVCDTRSSSVTVLDLPKKQTRLMGVTGFNPLQSPVDIAIADDGMIYVADKTRGVAVFTPSERYVQVMGIPKMQAIGIAVHGSKLYVCNMTTQNIAILDRHNGDLLGSIGTVGDEDGQFRLPLGIDIDSQGNLHVVDLMRCRLQKFGPDGKFVAGVGEATDVAGNFVRPKQLTVDSEGLVYVVDAAFQNVQVFDSKYRLLTSFGGPGRHPGAMDLPAGICVWDGGIELFQNEIHPFFEAKRLILITNQFGGDKVAAYALGQLRPGRTVQELSASMAPLDPDTLQEGETNPMSDPPGELSDEPTEENSEEEENPDEEGR